MRPPGNGIVTLSQGRTANRHVQVKSGAARADAISLQGNWSPVNSDSTVSERLPGSIILSQTDRIGDAIATLPMAGLIKHHAPGTRVIALGRRYTEAIWRACPHIDDLILLEELRTPGAAVERLKGANAEAIVHVWPDREVAHWARQADIPTRVGSSRRLHHWTTCNVRPWVRRKVSGLHTVVLNARLLEPFGVRAPRDAVALAAYGRLDAPPLGAGVGALLRAGRRNVVVHPFTAGGGPAWGLQNYAALIAALDPDRYHCIVTGTAEEARRYRAVLPLARPHVTDAGGMLELAQLMQLIGAADALVAASTGPLHLAAALGRRAIGLYTMRDHAAPARWRPLGADAHALVFDPNCRTCAVKSDCDCIERIIPARVIELLER
jgi:heptosyltransferase-3